MSDRVNDPHPVNVYAAAREGALDAVRQAGVDVILELAFAVVGRGTSLPGPIGQDLVASLDLGTRTELAVALEQRALELLPELAGVPLSKIANLGRITAGDVVHATVPAKMDAQGARNVQMILKRLLGDNVTIVVGPEGIELEHRPA